MDEDTIAIIALVGAVLWLVLFITYSWRRGELSMRYVESWWRWSTGPGAVRKLVGFGLPALVALIVIAGIVGETEEEPGDGPTDAEVAAGIGADTAPTASASGSINVTISVNTPTPEPPAATATAEPTPEPPGFSFGGGTKLVGTEVQPTTYRTRQGSSNCYWARLSGLGGTIGDIIANDNTSGPTVITIEPTDVAFQSSGCATWTQDLSPLRPDSSAPFDGDGIYIVGVDVAPGTWRADAADSCYWARLSGFGGGIDNIIANGNDAGPVIAIGPTDAGFETSRCGTWTKIQ